MPDLRPSSVMSAPRLALWLLRNRWLSSLTVLVACLATALGVSRASHLAGFQPWIVITLATATLSGGLLSRSQGWLRWSQRLPVDPRSVWSARLIWLVLLALPAILAVGIPPASQPSSVMAVDPDFNWTRCARSAAWLIGLAAAILAPGPGRDRFAFAGGTAAWFAATGISMSSAASAGTGAILHDLALAAVTVCYVLATVGQRPAAGLFGVRFLMFGISLRYVPSLEALAGAPLLFSCAGLAVVGWSALVRSGRVRRLGASLEALAGTPLLQSFSSVLGRVSRSVFSCAGLAVVGWSALVRSGLVRRLGAIPGLSVITGAVAAVSLVVTFVSMMWRLFQVPSDLLEGAMAAARLEYLYAVGPGPLVTSSRLLGVAFVGWMVVLGRGELKRARAVDRWTRRRALLERMPLTRGQVIARAIMPQLTIVAFHGLLVLIIGLTAAALHRLFGIEGVSQVWQRGTLILYLSLAYLLVAQILTFRRGLDRLPWIAALALAAIALWTSVSQLAWPIILTLSFIALPSLAAISSKLWNPVVGR